MCCRASTHLNNYSYAYYNNPTWTNYSVQAQIQFSTTNGWGGAIGGRLNPATGARYTSGFIRKIPWPRTTAFQPDRRPCRSSSMKAGRTTRRRSWCRCPVWAPACTRLKVTFQGSNVLAYFDGILITNLDGQRNL